MPIYIASGSFVDENSGVKYRFLVLPRYDIDLQKIIAKGRTLDLKNVLILALQILDVLEYLHKEGYTHSDIKSSNLMLGFEGSRLSKAPTVKPAQSFQKQTKEVTVLSGKQRRPKTSKSRSANYYEDKDFVVKFSSHDSSGEDSGDKNFNNVKKSFRKILSNRDNRTLHRHHAFNLRHLSNYVNYEDLNSSVCSDQSYQKLIDDFENKKHLVYSDTSKVSKRNLKSTPLPPIFNDNIPVDIFKEAILSQSSGQIYLLDYGLASKFLDSYGVHKDFDMDARKAHDGTLEYSSRDSHVGAHSRRSDLETLGYNLLDWLTGILPWKTTQVLAEPDLVHALKKNFMSDVKSLLMACFKTNHYPQFLEKYFQYVTSLDFTEKPDYDFCRNIFKTEFARNGFGSDKDMSLCFVQTIQPMNHKKICYSKRFCNKNTPSDFISRNGVKKTYERENIYSLENNLKLELLKQTLNSSSDGMRKPCTSRNFFISDTDLVARLKKSLMPHHVLGKKLSPKNLRSNKRQIQKRRGKRIHRNSIGKFGNFMGSAKQFTWAEILAGNPEDIIRKDRTTTFEDDDEDTCKYRIRKMSNASDSSSTENIHSPLLQKDYLADKNPTYAMKEVIATLKKKNCTKSNKEIHPPEDKFLGYTPPMINLYKIKEKREINEKLQQTKEINIKKVSKEAVVPSPPRRSTRLARGKSQNNVTNSPVVQNKIVSSSKSEIIVPKKEAEVVKKSNATTKSILRSDKKEKNKKDTVEVKINKRTRTSSNVKSEYYLYFK